MPERKRLALRVEGQSFCDLGLDCFFCLLFFQNRYRIEFGDLVAGEVCRDESAGADDHKGQDVPDRGGAEVGSVQTEKGEHQGHDFVSE